MARSSKSKDLVTKENLDLSVERATTLSTFRYGIHNVCSLFKIGSNPSPPWKMTGNPSFFYYF